MQCCLGGALGPPTGNTPCSRSCVKKRVVRDGLQEVVYLLRHPSWEASIVHTYRESNMCADFLASKGHNTDYEGVFFDICIPGLISLISADARGVCYPRAMV